jgi:hypothetical protein
MEGGYVHVVKNNGREMESAPPFYATTASQPPTSDLGKWTCLSLLKMSFNGLWANHSDSGLVLK